MDAAMADQQRCLWAEGVAILDQETTAARSTTLDASVRSVFLYLAGRILPPANLESAIELVVNTKPTSRLHEIVFELLAQDQSDDNGPGPFVRAQLLAIAIDLGQTDRPKALRFLAFSERDDFKCAMRMYMLRTGIYPSETHAEAFAKIPEVWKAAAREFFADMPDVCGGV